MPHLSLFHHHHHEEDQHRQTGKPDEAMSEKAPSSTRSVVDGKVATVSSTIPYALTSDKPTLQSGNPDSPSSLIGEKNELERDLADAWSSANRAPDVSKVDKVLLTVGMCQSNAPNAN